jgi:hypothetical protein
MSQLLNTPVHASWLNQVEMYCSIVQRKVLTPYDCASLEEVEPPAAICRFDSRVPPTAPGFEAHAHADNESLMSGPVRAQLLRVQRN